MMKPKTYPEKIEHLPLAFRILIYTFVRRLHSGKNCLVIVIGGTGSGKSLSSVCILYWCYIYMHGEPPTLEYMKAHWFFKAQDFLKKMNDPELNKGELNLWDEMGISASHKAHQSVQNKAISWLVQSFRNLEQMVVFTVPSALLIDKSVRNLLHYQLETRTILKKSKLCIIKPLELQYNTRMDKMFYHNLFYPSEDEKGLMEEVDVVGIPLPPKDFVNAYEDVAREFKAELNLKIQQMIQKADLVEQVKTLTDNEAALERCTDKQRAIYQKMEDGMTVQRELAEHFKVHDSTISEQISSMRKKGVNFDKFTKKNGVLGQLPQKNPRNNLTSNELQNQTKSKAKEEEKQQ